jgi:hypothetical protein
LASWKRFAHSHFYIAVIKTAAADLNEPVATGFFLFVLLAYTTSSESACLYTLDNYFASSLTHFMTVSPESKAGLGHQQDGRTDGWTGFCISFSSTRPHPINKLRNELGTTKTE